MVVGKRQARRAVDRNRIRRQIRESFRVRRIAQPLDVVILARPGAGACSNAMLAASMNRLWTRLEQRLRVSSENGEDGTGRRS